MNGLWCFHLIAYTDFGWTAWKESESTCVCNSSVYVAIRQMFGNMYGMSIELFSAPEICFFDRLRFIHICSIYLAEKLSSLIKKITKRQLSTHIESHTVLLFFTLKDKNYTVFKLN